MHARGEWRYRLFDSSSSAVRFSGEACDHRLAPRHAGMRWAGVYFAAVVGTGCSIERRETIGVEEFENSYSGKTPVIVTGALKSWPALEKWDEEEFMESSPLRLIVDHVLHFSYVADSEIGRIGVSIF